MNNLSFIAASIVGAGLAAHLAAARADSELFSAAAQFPQVKLACIAFQLPADAGQAARQVDLEQKKWYQAARAAKLTRSGSPFVSAVIAPPRPGDALADGKPIDAAMCGVIDQAVASVPGMTVERMAAAQGFAGTCVGRKVDACLQKASADAGYSDARPWPRLPIYAPLPDVGPPPADAAAVVAYLAAAQKEIPPEMTGEGRLSERSTNGLKPLIPCAAQGCPRQTAVVLEQSDRIAWFIHALPPAAQPAPAAGAGAGAGAEPGP